MNHLAIANVQSTVRIQIWVTNEVAVKILVIATKNYITRLKDAKRFFHMRAIHCILSWIIDKEQWKLEYLNASKLCH